MQRREILPFAVFRFPFSVIFFFPSILTYVAPRQPACETEAGEGR